MLAFYFCGAAVIAGSALSTGLFVPMLVIGCLIGALHCRAALPLQMNNPWQIAGRRCVCGRECRVHQSKLASRVFAGRIMGLITLDIAAMNQK